MELWKFKYINKVIIRQIYQLFKNDLNKIASYVIVLIYLLVIATNNRILKSKDENSKWCAWSNNKPLYDYDSRKSKTIAKYIDFLKELNVTYFLGHGSALGSIRNHGFIPRDRDVDINIPIWLNQHIFHCNKYIKYNSTVHKRNCHIYVRPYIKVCNKHRIDYMKMFKKYAEKKLNKQIHYYNCQIWDSFKYTSCWLFRENRIFLDLFFLLGNEYVYDEMNICKCHFSGIDTYCLESNVKDMIKSYGRDYLKPLDYSGSCKSTLITPTKHNSKLVSV